MAICPCINANRFIPTCVGNTLRGRTTAETWRFIPTCVGNTHRLQIGDIVLLVHPHVCGEYVTWSILASRDRGSSPRVWGILCRRSRNQPGDRFIPTCVGNTPPDSSLQKPVPVHPHVCGEYGVRRPLCLGIRGSSPRVWGILVICVDSNAHMRFIPTCVGNTLR